MKASSVLTQNTALLAGGISVYRNGSSAVTMTGTNTRVTGNTPTVQCNEFDYGSNPPITYCTMP
ncbi:MAG: hypothetical protein ACKOCK_01540 [Chloroflexota bacterium]